MIKKILIRQNKFLLYPNGGAITMRLFSKKKEEERPHELPPLKFPEFPKEQKITLFEKPPSETENIKKAVNQPFFYERDSIEEQSLPKRDINEKPAKNETEGNTLFVKIENFRSVKEKMEDIKDKISETEKILDKIDELRREEEKELTKWGNDLNSIKTKLLAIDKNLFE
jgi:hypothetical protein